MDSSFPFAWQLRLSKRAKRPRITISPQGIVELVWPHRMPKKHVQSMLHEHTSWVLKHLSSLDVPSESSVLAPEQIDFKSIGELWQVSYEQRQGRFNLVEQNLKLQISGDIHHQQALRYTLQSWVKKQGKIHLKPWLADVAKDMNLSYQSVSIRLQKHRWGSCSAQGNISLNAALLFLPDFLVRHVLIHELTHLKHLNHSPEFWESVANFDVNYKQHKQQLKIYSADVPAWLTQPFRE